MLPTVSPTAGQSSRSPGPLWCLAGSGLLLALLFLTYGFPINDQAWVAIAFGVFLAMHSLVRGRWSLLGCVAPLYFLAFFLPLETHNLMDRRGGRWGVELRPGGFRFGNAGCNTHLLERYLGPLEADWMHASTRSMLFGTWRDGNERVNTRSVIFCEHLPRMLQMLPTHESRLRVLQCATDTNNLLRVHQGFLLSCLQEWAFPPGYNAESWWSRHEHLFRHEYNPKAAVDLVAGWHDTVRKKVDADGKDHWTIYSALNAVSYQQRGSWGGDLSFGGVYMQLEEDCWKDGKRKPVTGLKEVVWWP